jgi:hypothetical protein
VQRVLESIRSLPHLSNRRMYTWNQEQPRKIWDAIDKELKKCMGGFEHSEPEEFKL